MADANPPSPPEGAPPRASSPSAANAEAQVERPAAKEPRDQDPGPPPAAAGWDSGVGPTWPLDDSTGASYAWAGGDVRTTGSLRGPLGVATSVGTVPRGLRSDMRSQQHSAPQEWESGLGHNGTLAWHGPPTQEPAARSSLYLRPGVVLPADMRAERLPRNLPPTRPLELPANDALPFHPAAPPNFEQRSVPEEHTRPPREYNNYRAPVSASSVLHIMQKWNISYSGKKGEDVDAFLTRIAEGRALIPVSETDLIRCVPFFLTGVALQWFRNDSPNWTSWSQFEAACRIRFGDPDYQYALREEIMRRTQGLDEPVADYITCLRGLFARLQPPWDESRQIQYAHRNLIPRLHIAIHRDDMFDFASFEHVAVRVEKSFLAARTYRAPPPPGQSLFPNLAYQGSKTAPATPSRKAYVATETWPEIGGSDPVPESEGAAPAAAQPAPSRPASGGVNAVKTHPPASRRKKAPRPAPAPKGPKPAETPDPLQALNPFSDTEPAPSSEAPRRPTECWNCGKPGHRFTACREQRKTFCYRCGRDGVKSPDCTCAGNR